MRAVVGVHAQADFARNSEFEQFLIEYYAQRPADLIKLITMYIAKVGAFLEALLRLFERVRGVLASDCGQQLQARFEKSETSSRTTTAKPT